MVRNQISVLQKTLEEAENLVYLLQKDKNLSDCYPYAIDDCIKIRNKINSLYGDLFIDLCSKTYTESLDEIYFENTLDYI